MSSQDTFYVILPDDTKIVAANWEGAPAFTLIGPAAALVTLVWPNSFQAYALFDENGTVVETGLTSNYVMLPPTSFAQGATAAEAWDNFHKEEES